MPPRPLACLAAALVLAGVVPARGSDTAFPPALAAVHSRLDAHDIPGSRRALAWLATEPLDSSSALALEAARGRFALLTYDLDPARATLTAAVRDADAAGASVLAARSRVWLAQTLVALGDVPAARELTRTAYDALVVEHDERGEFGALQLLTTFSHVNQRTLMVRQLKIASDLDEPVLEARVRNHWASALLGAGRFGPALAEAEHAERLARSRPQQGGWLISHALGFHAWALRAHGDYPAALALNREAVREAMAYGDLESAAWNWVGAGDSLDGMLRAREMAEAMRQGLAVARRSGMPALIHSLTASVARGEFLNRRWGAAARMYEEALARPLGDSPVYPRVRLSECRRQLGQLDEALRQVDRALAAARERTEPDGETQALAQRAEVLQDLGREDEARRSIADCLERLEAMRRDLAPSDLLKRGFADVHDDYAVAVDILGRQHRAEDALAAAEQGRARALADLLLSRRAAERTQMADDSDTGQWRLDATPPETADRPADATALTPDDPPDLPEDVAFRSTAAAPALDARALADLARRLDTTLVVYWIQDRGSYVWAVGQDGSVHCARIALGRAAIDDLVRIATTSWPNVAVRGSPPTHVASAPHEAAPALSRLYSALVAPIAAWLPSAPGARLTIVPHGSLFQLSFGALIDPRGRYLIERYSTGYAPGGAALADALTPHVDRPAAVGALLVADPRRAVSPDGTVLPQLAGARAEVRLVARTLSAEDISDTVLVGEAATEEAVRAAAPHAKVIHFAAHAFADEGGNRDPFIALASSRSAHAARAADGRLTASEIYALPLTADLVVLSACRSASGKISSDGIADLSRAFIAAGAPSVVASLWEAADAPTAILMKAFYRAYAAGAPKDRALRDAQLHLLRELRAGHVTVDVNGTRTTLPEHPMFWAGFVLQGKP
jgi:CHAT domain-containing protein/tetratricopeptide (TPR) repeat protein